MTVIVLDTHSLLWYLTSDKHLSTKAKKAIESAQKKGYILIPIIVLVETLHLLEKKKVNIEFLSFYETIKKEKSWHLIPLDEILLLELVKYPKFIDLHDRIIVATTKLFGAKLVTKDEKIREVKVVKTIW